MVQRGAVNLTSLGLVSDELVITIEHAANKLEQYVLNPTESESLVECISSIEQVSGTLNLVQLEGGEALAREILAATQVIQREDEPSESLLSVITDAFFILPRYLEYVQQTRRALPVILIPYINQLRESRKEPLMAESSFFDVEVEVDVSRPSGSFRSDTLPDDFPLLVKRLRHMYQLGLLNALQGKQVKSAIGIMQRALTRLDVLCGFSPFGILTWTGAIALEGMQVDSMELTKSRKMLLAGIDRQLRQLQKEGQSYLEKTPPADLIKYLIYIAALVKDPSEKSTLMLNAFDVVSLDINDELLRKERESLKGPSANTVSSMAIVLKDELRSTKDILENASQMGEGGIGDYDDLLTTLGKVADILALVGLVSASNTLKEELTKIETWKQSGEAVDPKEFIEVADTLLYVESTISGLEKLNLSDEELNMANTLARREVIASTQLAEAELLVIQEAESGLALVKRALNSYSESHYDTAHIQNVSATLISVRGGLVVLNLSRAASVVEGCIRFVDGTLTSDSQVAAMHQLLETFADAIIGLEYYLDAIKSDKEADASVLSIAEESLEALGCSVETSDDPS